MSWLSDLLYRFFFSFVVIAKEDRMDEGELGLNPDKQTVRPCLVSTNFARDCLVTKNHALSLSKPTVRSAQ